MLGTGCWVLGAGCCLLFAVCCLLNHPLCHNSIGGAMGESHRRTKLCILCPSICALLSPMMNRNEWIVLR